MKNILLRKGSVLVFSFIVLVSLLSIIAISMKERFGDDKVTRSFQVADRGAEKVLHEFSRKDLTDLVSLAEAVGGVCADGYIVESTVSGTFNLGLYDDSGTRITDCSDTGWRERAVSVRSEGYSEPAARMVETAEAQAVGNKNCHAVGPIGSGSWSCGTNEYVQMVMANGTMATQMFVMCCQF